MINKISLLLSLLLFNGVTYSQNQNNNWYFGDRAGLDFNSGTPIALTNGQLFTNEGCSSISDNSGNLLFYTDGRTVWNKTHIVMPNGTGLLGHPSTTQSALIVPDPANSSRYYIFTIGELGGAMNYSIVDMNLQSGNGDVTTTKNVLLHSAVSEKQTAVQKCDGNIWVISHEYNTNKFYADLITSAGISPSVISSIGAVHAGGGGGGTFNSVGYLKMSQQGNRLALAIRDIGVFEVFDFDINTGIISNSISLNPGSYSPAYGVEFSPDGTKLYGSVISSGRVYQFNLMAGSASAIAASATLVGTLSGLGCALQLGPNGKIYIAQPNSQTSGVGFLGVINFPNLLGSSCSFVNNGISLGGKLSLLGLPNLIVRQLGGPINISVSGNTVICSGQSTVLTVTGALNYQWSGGVTSSGSAITVSPGVTTKYYVSGTNGSCGSDTDSITVTVNPLPVISVSGNMNICAGQNTSLTASGGSSYKWDSGNFSTTNPVTVSPITNTTYTVVANDGTCSSLPTTIVVQVTPLPNVFITGSTNICNGDSVTLNANGATSYQWSGGYLSTASSITVKPMITTTYYVSGNTGSCNDKDTIIVNVQAVPTASISGNLSICEGQSTTLTATGGNSYQWTGGITSTNTSITVSPTTTSTYSVIASNGFCFSPSVTVAVIVKPLPTVTISGNGIICSGDSTSLAAISTIPSTIQWSGGSTSTNPLITVNPIVTTNYYVTATASGCSAKDTFTVVVAPVVQAQFSYQTSDCSSEVAFMNILPGTSGFYWNFGDGTYSNIANPSHVYIPGTYTVLMVVNANTNCADSVQQTIIVTGDTLQQLIIPNVFTPNGDGVNDEFRISGLSICDDYHMQIYNRWGQKVFETDSPRTVSWNGLNGEKKKIVEGIYFYILIPAKNIGNTIKGSLTLIR